MKLVLRMTGAVVLSVLAGVGGALPAAYSLEPVSRIKEPIRPLGEWEGRRRLVMVFQPPSAGSNASAKTRKAIRDAYFQVIGQAISRVNITAVFPRFEEASGLLGRIYGGELEPHLWAGRLALEIIETDSQWIRDYGVLLARGKKTGSLYGIDPVYAQNFFYRNRARDDDMMVWLFQGVNIRWRRSPLILDGGNFETDGEGLCFTSGDSMALNETDGERGDRLFRSELGCRETVFLEPIPMELTAHLDMFFKVLSPDLWVLGEYLPGKDPRTPAGRLESMARAAMEKNAAVLREVLRRRGKGRLVRMPMPRPVFVRAGGGVRNDPRSGNWSLASIAGSKAGAESDILFPTYVNPIYLRGARGEVVVIPSYASDERAARAVAIYRAAYPRAKIIRMPSDVFIRNRGAVHCVLYAMPE